MSSRVALAAVVVIVAVAVGLHLPGLGTGLLADDYLQRAMARGHSYLARAPWDLYSFYGGRHELGALQASGTLPWWIPPELRLSLLRPLPSLLLWLEYRVLALSPFTMHLHSLAWLLGLLAAFSLLARRVLPAGAALLGTALFAFDLALVSPVAWLANRATLICATFSALALWAYHTERETGSRRAGWLTALAFSLALAAGEYALCAIAFVLAHELWAVRAPFAARRRALAGVLGPAAAYGVVYLLGRYGASGGSVYVGPFDSPLEFAKGALVRVPSLLSTELLLLPGEAVYVALVTRSPLLAWAVVPLLLVLLFIGLSLRGLPAPLSRRFFAYALGLGLSIVPLSGTVPGVRLLLVPSLGGSLVLAAAFWGVLRRLRSASGRRSFGSWLLALFALPLLSLHLVLSPLVARRQSAAHAAEAERQRQAAYTSEIDDAAVASQHLVLLNQPADLVAVNYTVRARAERGSPMPASWRTLSSALVPLVVARTADDSLELIVANAGDGLFNYDESRHESPEEPFRPGQRFVIPGLEVEILEVRGWAPSRVRYRFPGSLEDPSRVLLRFEHGRLVRFPVPPIGGSAPLPLGFP